MAVDERHHQIQHHEIGQLLTRAALQEFERLTTVTRWNDVVTFRLE